MPTASFTKVGWNTWNVPDGVTNVTVTIDGAGSGSRRGGRVTGKLDVSDKWNLYIHIGGAGKVNSGTTAGAATIGGGGAGGGGNLQDGGDSGGGASYIRVNSTTGTLKAVAGGAGGDSGDGGPGGDGGGTTGRNGRVGTSGTEQTGDATGGTQSQGGNGGTSSRGSQFNGKNALDTVLATAGAGGRATAGTRCHGGGGGGGGYHPGGGGQAAATGYAPGGGGGGGSSYTGGLTGATNQQGAAGTGNGVVHLSWVSGTAKNQPPTPPSAPEINDQTAVAEHLTKSTGSVKIDALVNDPDAGEDVQLIARYSTSSSFSSYTDVASAFVGRNKRVALTLTRLVQNTHYYVRLYTRDEHKLWSQSYNGIDFWTNKAPFTDSYTVNTQGSGMTLPTLDSATFSWLHHDPDAADYQTGFQLRYRTAATSIRPAGSWVVITQNVAQNLPPKVPGPPSSAKNQWVFDPQTFKGNTFYEWQVRTKDGQGLWGTFGSTLFTFFVSSTSSPPIPVLPRNNTPVDVTEPTTFTWRFVDPEPGDTQKKADLRYRAIGNTKELAGGGAVGGGEWVTLLGDLAPGTPGANKTWTLEPGRFVDGYTYEWAVRTYDTVGSTISDWSDPVRFYAIDTPGAQATPLPVGPGDLVQGTLGCGSYRVFIYQQGGQIRLGEVDPITSLNFKRVRDDISNCLVLSSGYSTDCGALYASVSSWMHEIVVFRDGVRVWEGPITRITYTTTSVEFEAKDVMAYAYRRIMRQGYNDAYRLTRAGTNGQPNEFLGLLSAVRRASMIITQALAPYDPNVLPYLTTIEYPDDAQESRVVANWSRSAWEEVDDLAATAGIDYTTVGRRILIWDTHRAIGRLPELRDGDFSESPIVTEYGMQLATFFAVTNGSGVVGYTEVKAKTKPYGPVELLASAYNDSATASGEVQTPEALAQAQKALTAQSKRNISGRWPTPLIVRVPDNSSLSPDCNLGFQQLIPGVWLPLRSVNTARQVLQWQKLDSVNVDVDDKGETVKVVMSPAPNGGNDPDAESAAEAD